MSDFRPPRDFDRSGSGQSAASVAFEDVSHTCPSGPVAEIDHDYGPNVHLLDDVVGRTLLARFASSDVAQPELGQLIRTLYTTLASAAIRSVCETEVRRVSSRMAAVAPEGHYRARLLKQDVPITVAALIRAGIIPAQTVFDFLHQLYAPSQLRMDHIFANRATDAAGAVTGVAMAGHKLSESPPGSVCLIPDPMGATGHTILSTIQLYQSHWHREANRMCRFVCLHLMVTPEYLRAVMGCGAPVDVFALRLDRGLSAPDVLKSRPGSRWNEERGLTDRHYIVPGAGGVGELLNNTTS